MGNTTDKSVGALETATDDELIYELGCRQRDLLVIYRQTQKDGITNETTVKHNCVDLLVAVGLAARAQFLLFATTPVLLAGKRPRRIG